MPKFFRGQRQDQFVTGRAIDLLVAARKLNGVTQQAVEKELGLSNGAFNRLENGHRGIRLDGFLRWCRVVGVKPERVIQSART